MAAVARAATKPLLLPRTAEKRFGTFWATRAVIHHVPLFTPGAVGIGCEVEGFASLLMVTLWLEPAVGSKPFCWAYKQASSTGLLALVSAPGQVYGVGLLQTQPGAVEPEPQEKTEPVFVAL